jgi:hypothetical protein
MLLPYLDRVRVYKKESRKSICIGIDLVCKAEVLFLQFLVNY